MDIANFASLLADPSRAEIVSALMGVTALPASELAASAGITPQTASGHLAKLLEGGLLSVEQYGRHRYYRITSAELAEMIERMALFGMNKNASQKKSALAPESPLRRARTCYDHLAGDLGVKLLSGLIEKGCVRESETGYFVPENSSPVFTKLGIDINEVTQKRRQFAPRCLDWSERRYHVAGGLGAAIANRLFEMNWLRRVPNSRIVVPTKKGKTGIFSTFGVAIY